jgi:ATP-dependent DNA ligase
MLRPPIEPMLAKAVLHLPELGVDGWDWRLEPKFDGFRVIAFRRPDDVFLQSRAGRPLAPYFPDIARLVGGALPANVVVDGELIVWQPDRHRTSFALLQRRLTAGARLLRVAHEHPAHLVIFDLLQDDNGQELLTQPLTHRRTRLADLLTDAPPQLPMCPQTNSPDEAVEWLNAWTATGIEGLIAKNGLGRYTPGRRGWLKYRVRATAEAIIGGVTGTLTQPETLLLGRLDATDRLRYTGRTGRLTTAQQSELAPLLASAPPARSGGIAHPWPQPLPASWIGQLDHPQPLLYWQVQPTVVAEIYVDTAFEHHRWRHPVRYLRVRSEMSVYDVPLLTQP